MILVKRALPIWCAIIAVLWIPIANALPPQGVKLTAGDAFAGDQFGTVAIDGDTIVVGAQFGSKGGTGRSGSAYVFVKNGEVRTQQQKLTASDAESIDRFGSSVAISGDTIVVGAFGDDDACPGDENCNSGSAYVFVRNGGVWTQQQKLTASDASADDEFGFSVAISDDTIVVGAFGDDDAGTSPGAAYVFARQGNVWTEQQKLTASDAETHDEFGATAAISGDTLVIGAMGDDDACSPGTDSCNSGSAYVFVRNGNVWTQQQKLTASDARPRDQFGFVAISGETIVVGAPGFLGGVNVSGSAYVFVRQRGAWTQQQKLVAADGEAGDRFGFSVAISGDTIVAGAFHDDDACPGDPLNCNSGSAHVFVRHGNVWTALNKLTAMDASAGDGFGFPVAISGETIAAGAVGDDDAGGDSGAAYVFRLIATCSIDPPNDRRPLGGEYAAEITLLSSGKPVSGIPVALEVTGGPNKGLTMNSVTGSSGQATFNYAGNNQPGVDTIEISGSVGGEDFSCTAIVEWTDGPIITIVNERKGTTGRNLVVKGFNFQRGDKVFVNDQEAPKTKFKNSKKLVAKKAMDLLRACPGGVPTPNEIKVVGTSGRTDTFALTTCP